jgi:hypothetical protein
VLQVVVVKQGADGGKVLVADAAFAEPILAELILAARLGQEHLG